MAKSTTLAGILLVAVLLASHADGAFLPLKHGLQKRIMYGSDAQPQPFTCAIQVNIDGDFQQKCGAVIYNENTLISAAQCLDTTVDSNVELDNLRIVCGTTDMSNMNENGIRNVTEAVLHPGWSKLPNDRPLYPNDIATLRLETPLVFDSDIQAAVLDDAETKLTDSCVITGWGMNEYAQYPDILQEVTMKRITDKVCASKWRDNKSAWVGEDHVCFWNRNSKKGICYNDGGGPATCDGVVVGIASWAYPNCMFYKHYPQVFTQVSSYLDFIQENSWA